MTELKSTGGVLEVSSSGGPAGPAGPVAPAPTVPATNSRRWRFRRRVLVGAWLLALTTYVVSAGIPTDKFVLMAWAATGLAAVTAGRGTARAIALDWSLFAVSLLAWQLSRGAADAMGRPTLWTPQVDFDRALFGGHSLNVVLQSHLKQSTPPWWEALTALTYVSFYVLPYVVAAVLWLRSRRSYWQFTGRFIAISLLAVVFFVLSPSAPPWAAARCSAAQVASQPADPYCLSHRSTTADGLLGPMTAFNPGAAPYVQQFSSRGLVRLHLTRAANLVASGQESVNRVAAIPSLHAAVSLLLTLFLWPRVRRAWRVLLALYPLAMAFALMYAGEHYTLDILAGWLLTTVVCLVFSALERRRPGERGSAGPIPWAAPSFRLQGNHRANRAQRRRRQSQQAAGLRLPVG